MTRSLMRRRLMRERVLVTTFEAETFEGVLLEADDRHLVLVDAAQVAPNGDRVKVDGQLWLPAASVSYLQKPGV